MNPDLSQDLSLFQLILHASVPVQLVMLLLLGASLMSWWFIFIKLFALKRALRLTDSFEHEFWAGGDINAMYQRVVAERETAGEMERIFEAGFREYMKLRQQAGLSLNVIIDGTRRAMRATYQRELDGLDETAVTSLKDEIDVMRVFSRKVAELGAEVNELDEAKSLLNTLANATGSINRLVRTHTRIPDPELDPAYLLRTALLELEEEWPELKKFAEKYRNKESRE